MPEGEGIEPGPFGRSGRGATPAMAAVIMIVVILIVGGAGYAGLSATSSGGSATRSTCEPVTSPACKSSVANDVTTFTPFKPGLGSTFVSVPQGTSVPVTVGLSGGESASNFSVTWGDSALASGTTYSTSPTQSHIYNSLGTFIISAEALVGTSWHTGTHALIVVQVVPSLATSSSGVYPTLTTSLTNGSSTTTGNTGYIVQGGGPIVVSGLYAAPPLNPSYVTGSPKILNSGGTCSATNTTSSASASCTFANSGVYTLTFTGAITYLPASAVQDWANYTWTVYVTPTGVTPSCAACIAVARGNSPHPGTLDIYEIAAGGGTTMDPGIDYESVGAEVILNTYENLITYNGTDVGVDPSNYVPLLATCVPGTSGCAKMYGGNDLLVDNSSNGQPEYYTYAIDPNARFYDSATGNSWAVYPTDVMYSAARQIALGTYPANPGWILAQSLTPGTGNASWDAGLHAMGYGPDSNNTVNNIMDSMLVNDTTYCPPAALAANGCITFNAWADGHTWAYFQETIASPWGLTVYPCGWTSVYGASPLPGFVLPTAKNGDGSCMLPGSATSTSQSAYQTWLASVSKAGSNVLDTGWYSWDGVTALGISGYPYPYPNLEYHSAGEGPYYVVSYNKAVGYVLQANPAYHAPTCAGQPGCWPIAATYAPHVNVYWDPDDTIGIQEYLAGQADSAGYDTADTGEILQLVKNNQISLYTAPTLDIDQIEVNLQFNATSLTTLVGSSPGFNIPGDFFAQSGLRQFLDHAFPYSTFINSLYTVDGVQYAEPYGGIIPHGMGNYYPTNVTWPAGNPDANPADVGGAAWWWANITNSKSPAYDPELAKCTSSAPCVFPILGLQGVPSLNQAFTDYAQSIKTLSNGALTPYVFPITFEQSVTTCALGPGENPCDFFRLGWAPDYPDPSDYIGPYIEPNSIFTYDDALSEALSGVYATATTYNASSCGHWDVISYWANLALLPNDCQWPAYSTMLYAFALAAATSGAARTLLFNMAEHILNTLGLYVYTFQTVGVGTAANWVNQATINQNIVTGSVDQFWFLWNGNHVVS